MLSEEDLHPPLCILYALPEESAPLLRLLTRREETTLGEKQVPCTLGYLSNLDAFPIIWPLRVACSGVGRRKAAETARLLLEQPGSLVKCLLILGFGGGLAPEARPGNLVIADRVLLAGEDSEGIETYMADSTLVMTAESVRLEGITLGRGALATVDRVLIESKEKQALAKRTGAVVVDMETAGAVQIAQERGVPWLAVRAITDGVEDVLPLDFNALADAEGNVDRGRVVRATLAQPWKIPSLLRLGKRSSRAADHLTQFLEAFLTGLAE